MSEKYVLITDQAAGKDLQLPVVEGTEGEPYAGHQGVAFDAGLFHLRPGFFRHGGLYQQPDIH